MTVQRFGTSSAPCPNGIYVRHSDYAALEAECERLRAAISNPIAMKIRLSPIESHMMDGYSQALADDAIKRGKQVIVYYGEARPYRASPSTRDCPKCGERDLPAKTYCKGIDCPLNPNAKNT
jgi:hypothetical protein